MERSRETRKASILGSKGLKRRRHRANSLRDSPDKDGRVELQASGRLRDRVKKDRDLREMERDFRVRGLRKKGSKRRRREDDETSEESFDDNDEDEKTTTTASAGRLFPSSSGSISNNNHSQQQRTNNHRLQHRKSYPPGLSSSSSSSSRILRGSPVWKHGDGDGFISSSVPRKARSASTKRSRDWNSSSSNNINVRAGYGGGGTEQVFRRVSTSPTRQSGAFSTSPPSQSAPMSPPSSSSNSFFVKKLKTKRNNTGSNLKPPKPAPSKQNYSNREDLEMEIAEVLYGLMTRSKGQSSKKEDSTESSRSNGDSKSPLKSTSGPTQTVATKRKRPRQVDDNLDHDDRPYPYSDKAVEMDDGPKGVVSHPSLEKTSRTTGENGFEREDNLVNSQEQPEEPAIAEETIESTYFVNKESCLVKNEDKFCNDSDSTVTAFSPVVKIKAKSKVSEVDIQREQKFEIDLMAPFPRVPPARSSPESQKSILSTFDAESKPEVSNDKENEVQKSAEWHNSAAEESKSKEESEETVAKKKIDNNLRNIDLQFDFGKAEINENKFHQQQKMLTETNKEEKLGPPKSLSPLPMASWSGGLPPMGYTAPPLQGVVPADGPTVAPLMMQPLFTQARPKRCATHSYIARNIHCMQQLTKMNPFLQAAAGPTSLSGSKPCNPIVLPMDPVGNVAGKALNNNSAHDKSPQNVISSGFVQRKQQIPIQQAFIFPYQQQAAMAAAASARPNSTKPPSTTGGSASSNPSSSAGAATMAMSFNYPPLPANETQYLATLQNNGYPFPIPPVGLPPNYWGPPAQALPFFNGFFYPSQMIHPSQIQHHQQTPPTQPSQNNLSSQQPRSQSSSALGSTNNPTQKSQRSSQQSLGHHGHLSPLGREDSPTTMTDSSRGSRAPVSMYGPNFTMPIHPQNLATMTQSSNQSEKRLQHSQQFAMSFGTINPGINVAPMAQNHAIFQNIPEATKQNIQNMMAAAAAAAQAAHNNNSSNNNSGISEDGKSRAADSSTNEAERKNLSAKAQNGFRQQSIAFSRSDLAASPVFESSGRALNAVTRTSLPVMNNASGAMNVSSVQNHIQGQLHLQHQLKQQQQMEIRRSKTQGTSSNGPVFTEHLKNNLLQNLAQNNVSPSQSSRHWKNTSRTPISQASSLASSTSLKNHKSRPAMHNDYISLGANPKPTTSSNLQGQVPMSPTNSSFSKGSSRTTSSNSTNNKTGQGPAQQPKNLPSILGNHNAVKTQMQPQLFFSNPYSQVQSPHSTSTSSITSGSNGFHIQRKMSDQHQQHGLLNSTSMNDPAKAFAVATGNAKGGISSSQGIMQAATFAGPRGGTFLPVGFSSVNPVSAAVQVKPAEPKQPAGNDNIHAWQPDKK